jgi:hypothetical protein
MARAQKAALPIVWQRGLRAHLEFVAGRAAQVRANTDTDEKFGLDGSHLVACISGRQFVRVALGLRISKLGLYFFQGFQLLWCATDDPNWLATPFNRELFTRLDAGDVHLNRCAGGLGAFGRAECADKGNSDRCSPCHTGATRGDEPSAFACVYCGFTHARPLNFIAIIENPQF